jgi:hypothetical protein
LDLSGKRITSWTILTSVAEPRHFDAFQAPGKIFDAAQAGFYVF